LVHGTQAGISQALRGGDDSVIYMLAPAVSSNVPVPVAKGFKGITVEGSGAVSCVDITWGRRLQSDALCGPLAQLVEHRTFNPMVDGSSPSRLILEAPLLRGFWLAGIGSLRGVGSIRPECSPKAHAASCFPAVFLQSRTRWLRYMPCTSGTRLRYSGDTGFGTKATLPQGLRLLGSHLRQATNAAKLPSKQGRPSRPGQR
jgi:hypothetical protein